MVKKHDIPLRPSARLRYKPIPTTHIPPHNTQSTGTKKPKLAPLLIGGALLYVTATYVSMIVFKSKSDTANTISHSTTNANTDQPPIATNTTEAPVTPSNFDTKNIWEQVARKYDQEIGLDEKVMGIGLLRRWLIRKAKGDVLEVSSGTGRNFDYYQADQVTSLTVTDDHPSMIEQSQEKFIHHYKEKFHQTFVQFKKATIDEPATMDKKKYDTVVDTFGLCSCRDPVEALVSMADACKSEQSRILLLEHGRSHYHWLNHLLDKNVDQHVKKWGKERKKKKKKEKKEKPIVLY
ncbi:unnamed protein product [Cunninghamella blakesleeana]